MRRMCQPSVPPQFVPKGEYTILLMKWQCFPVRAPPPRSPAPEFLGQSAQPWPSVVFVGGGGGGVVSADAGGEGISGTETAMGAAATRPASLPVKMAVRDNDMMTPW